MKKILFLAMMIPGLVYAQTQKGIVYEDVNANGKRDKKEKALAGVSVTNGVDVVQTNANGEYELPVSDDNIFFVIKPANYKIVTDTNNLAKYYRIHKPKGSPDFQYKGVAPTGELPKSLDFGMIPQEESKIFTALFLEIRSRIRLKIWTGLHAGW